LKEMDFIDELFEEEEANSPNSGNEDEKEPEDYGNLHRQ